MQLEKRIANELLLRMSERSGVMTGKILSELSVKSNELSFELVNIFTRYNMLRGVQANIPVDVTEYIKYGSDHDGQRTVLLTPIHAIAMLREMCSSANYTTNICEAVSQIEKAFENIEVTRETR